MAERRAIVIGGGIAGMCAARALADSFNCVTVIERDRYPDGVAGRRGVPQGNMFHTLIERGRREVEALFPGFHRLMDERGAPRASFGFNATLLTPRGWTLPLRAPMLRGLYTSRTLLEATLRDLFRQQTSVEILEGTEVVKLVAAIRGDRKVCTGVVVRRAQSPGELSTIDGDLIVDASGGQTKSGIWLVELGLTPPWEDVLDPLLTYAGQWLRLRAGARWPAQWWWTHGVFVQRVPPDDVQGAHLMKQENDLWLLTLVAGSGMHPPTDSSGITRFVGGLRSPLIADMLPLFEPVSRATAYRLSKNRWRHYERWTGALGRFIAIGDAACVFNPNQGQGMSVAATEAGILRQCLRVEPLLDRVPERFLAAQGHFQKNPWRLATCNDLRFSSVVGDRTRAVRTFNWYRDQLAAAPDRRVQMRLRDIDQLLKPVSSMFDPVIAARMLWSRALTLHRREAERRERFGPLPPMVAAAF